MSKLNCSQLASQIKVWGSELGFQQIAITDADLDNYAKYLSSWIDKNYHGAMTYMAENHEKRCHPEQLHPGTIRIITARMDYSVSKSNSLHPMQQRDRAYVSRYARGRDYHKLVRKDCSS